MSERVFDKVASAPGRPQAAQLTGSLRVPGRNE